MLRVDVCGELDVPKECAASKIEDTAVLFISDDGKSCTNLISSTKSQNQYNLLHEENPLNGFSINK